ncbi:MAG TPA: TolC family protein [Gemmataceae bacterium]|nr:TolC family protein [Gemmataceae bacterium]
MDGRSLRKSILGGIVLATLLSVAVRRAPAQIVASLADDLILLTQRLRGKEVVRTHQHLGPGPGSMESVLPAHPGAPGQLPSEPTSSLTPGQANITPPSALAPAPLPTPLYGVLEIPAIADQGPPDGLTLDQAIERLLRDNPDLRTRSKEIPKAQADIVSAGLRNNPFVFGDVGNVPYGTYSPQRPGEVNYEITLIQPWDVNQKRKVRVRVAQSARSVVECLYQDAVRLQIDNLYTAFLDVLAAREALRQQQVGLQGMEAIAAETRKQFEKGGIIAEADLERVLVQRDSAFVAVEEAQTAVRQTKQTLSVLLNLPPGDVDCLDLHGAIGGFDLDLPCVDQLIALAVQTRPDLNAYRLGVQRAQTEVQMARADRWADVFVLYTPWSLVDNSPIGGQNATSWSLGALVTLPLFNRNQGNISRAQITVSQTVIELRGREQQVISDVQRAYRDYTTALSIVRYYQENILPRARHIHEEKLRLLKTRNVSVLAYFEAQKEYNEVVRRYLEASVRLRRNSLRLNTAVAQRIVP